MSPNQPIKILFIHPSNELYGSDVVLLKLVSTLDRRQFEPIVVLPCDVHYEGTLSRALSEQGITHYIIKMGVVRRRYFKLPGLFQYLFYLLHGIKQISRLIRRHNIDVIHSNTSAILGGAFAARLHRLPHVWHVHEILERPAWLGTLIYAFIRANSTRIVTISEAVARSIDPARTNPLVQVIWNGIDTTRFNPQVDGAPLRAGWNIHDHETLIGVVGRISSGKGQELLLAAAAQALKSAPNLRFAIVGDPIGGDEQRLAGLKAQAERLNIAASVRFIPFSSAMPAMMRAFDIVAVPSIVPEGLSLVALEALASARPVIAAAHGGPLEIIRHSENGLLVPPDDAGALAVALVDLALDQPRRDAMGQHGRQHVITYFSLQTFSQTFAEMYRAVVSDCA